MLVFFCVFFNQMRFMNRFSSLNQWVFTYAKALPIVVHRCMALHLRTHRAETSSADVPGGFFRSSFTIYKVTSVIFTATRRSYSNTLTIRCSLAVGHLRVENSCRGCRTVLWEYCGHAQTKCYSNGSLCLWDEMAANLWHHRVTPL